MAGETLRGRTEKNSQTTDLSPREHPVHRGLRWGLAAGGKAARDVGAACRWLEGEAGCCWKSSREGEVERRGEL